MAEGNDLSRRNVLKAVGATAGIGAGISPTAAAEDHGQHGEIEVVEDPSTRWDLIRTSLRADEFVDVYRHLHSEKRVDIDVYSSSALRVEDPDSANVKFVLMIPFTALDDAEAGGITTVVSDGTVDRAAASTRKMLDNNGIEVEMYNQSEGYSTTSQGSNDIVRREIVYDPDSAESSIETTTQEQVQTQSQGPCWFVNCCEICKIVYDTVRTVGCGFTTAGLCAAAGVGTGGAALTACAIIVPAVCSVWNDIQNRSNLSPKEVCSGETAPGGENGDLLYCK